jgi:hypothetical protein
MDTLYDRLDAYQKEMWRDKYPYLQREGGLWVIKKGGNGCRPVKAQAVIAMDKDPAPLPQDKSSTSAAGGAGKGGAKAASDKADKSPAIAASAEEKKQPKDDKDDEDACKMPPPFDLLDLPEGMQAMGFPYAAYCARRWFNGKAYAQKDSAAYDPGFVDTDSLKLSWVLGFGRLKQRYAHLLNSHQQDKTENIYNSEAEKELNRKFQNFIAQNNNRYTGTLDTLAYCNNDVQMLHQQFQFQFINVSAVDALGGYTSTMNDLVASLANFALYAAVASAEVFTKQYNWYGPVWYRCTHTQVEITHIYVYARDSYSFNDDMKYSQYLGHWNRSGVIIAYDAGAADVLNKISDKIEFEPENEPKEFLPPLPNHLDKPVDIKSSFKRKEVFYPVRNRDFQRWRELKGRGGDFVIFSNLERIKLPKSIWLDLGEKREPFKS